MPAPQNHVSSLFLTPDAKDGSKLPSYLLNKQMHILLEAGVSWDRLNPDLRAAFLLGYYLGNVRNGGHSQFMGNARNYYDGDPGRFLSWAMKAAERYEMQETLAIMRDVLIWMSENPEEAATQTGFTPHVSPALKPYDTALFSADTVDEQAWLARVNSLPACHAQTFLRMCSYEKGYVRFPAIISEIEELRLLTNFEPVTIVSEDSFEAAVKAAAYADPVAKAARLADLAEALPKPATCAALSLFTEGAHLPPAECLRAGAAKTRRPKKTGVLTTTSGDQAFIAELGKDSISVFEAMGDPDGLLEHGIDFNSYTANPPRGLIASLLYFTASKYRYERAIKRAIRKRALRKTRILGKVSKSVGDEIAALNRRFHLPEALALWMEQRQDSTAPANWRLDLVEADRICWRFKVSGTHLRVVASAKEVQISTGDNTMVFPFEDLHAVRQSSGVMA
ncbi:hypothetical protein KUV57_24615 [Epibacterium sp. DP7N7-1]|nr:hypothetical protein [Epibacterium sp. DP7N7-1]